MGIYRKLLGLSAEKRELRGAYWCCRSFSLLREKTLGTTSIAFLLYFELAGDM
jgi:hypothetical protein